MTPMTGKRIAISDPGYGGAAVRTLTQVQATGSARSSVRGSNYASPGRQKHGKNIPLVSTPHKLGVGYARGETSEEFSKFKFFWGSPNAEFSWVKTPQCYLDNRSSFRNTYFAWIIYSGEDYGQSRYFRQNHYFSLNPSKYRTLVSRNQRMGRKIQTYPA
jgi:hypothetical protein